MVQLFVETIPPVYACCDVLVTAADVASAARFQNEARRREHLAWRRIVRRELGRNVVIDYNAVGAPTVDIPNRHISVAHCRTSVAVAIADECVGVDIESLDRDFERAKARFMSSTEAALANHDNWAAMVWTAKEAIYKLYGRREVDLIGDIHIVAYDAASQYLTAQVGEMHNIVVEMSFYDHNIVVAVATQRG